MTSNAFFPAVKVFSLAAFECGFQKLGIATLQLENLPFTIVPSALGIPVNWNGFENN